VGAGPFQFGEGVRGEAGCGANRIEASRIAREHGWL